MPKSLKFDKVKMQFDAPVSALEKYNPAIKSAVSDDERTINILGLVGQTWDGTGMTSKIVSSVINRAEGKDITVNINSPGGDFFEGLAINTLLRAYKGNVHVRILGMAASAASVIALAGDEISIADGGFIMIHNSWTCSCGNQHDMREVADVLSKFDESMSLIYSEHTGIDRAEIHKMMDAETWINGEDAIKKGFADSRIETKEIDLDEDAANAYNSKLKLLDVSLAKAGMPRSERRKLIKEVTGTPSAADVITPSADDKPKAENALMDILNILTSYKES